MFTKLNNCNNAGPLQALNNTQVYEKHNMLPNHWRHMFEDQISRNYTREI